MNLKYHLRHAMKNLNYPVDQIMYLIFNITFWIYLKKVWLIELQKSQKNSQQNNSETVINYNDKEKPKERYISLDERQNLIDDLNLI